MYTYIHVYMLTSIDFTRQVVLVELYILKGYANLQWSMIVIYRYN